MVHYSGAPSMFTARKLEIFHLTAEDRFRFNTADQGFTVGQDMDGNNNAFDVNRKALDNRSSNICSKISPVADFREFPWISCILIKCLPAY